MPFLRILLQPKAYTQLTLSSTLDLAFKLYTSFLLIVQLIPALANDIKLTHPQRATLGRECLIHLASRSAFLL